MWIEIARERGREWDAKVKGGREMQYNTQTLFILRSRISCDETKISLRKSTPLLACARFYNQQQHVVRI